MGLGAPEGQGVLWLRAVRKRPQNSFAKVLAPGPEPAHTEIKMTNAEHIADENMTDRALVAIMCGYHKAMAGTRAYNIYDRLERLVRRGLVCVEDGAYGTILVWPTPAAHEIADDMQAEGVWDTHVAAIRAEVTLAK